MWQPVEQPDKLSNAQALIAMVIGTICLAVPIELIFWLVDALARYLKCQRHHIIWIACWLITIGVVAHKGRSHESI